jgi:hypothetical protein
MDDVEELCAELTRQGKVMWEKRRREGRKDNYVYSAPRKP